MRARVVYNWGLEQRTRAFYDHQQRLYYRVVRGSATAKEKQVAKHVALNLELKRAEAVRAEALAKL